MNDAGMLPTQGGTYALALRLAAPTVIRVLGRDVALAAGRYVYVGSAHGPGGLRARLGRHLRGGGRPRWHIDPLRAATVVEGWAYSLDAAVTECDLAQALAALPGATAPIPGFGASDCRAACPAHLAAVPVALSLDSVWLSLALTQIDDVLG